MENNKKEFTLSVFTENQVGLISKISTMFSKRKISLKSFSTSATESKNIYKFTIVVTETESLVKTLVRQLNRLVDVLKVYYNTNDEIIWQQLALYKLPTSVIMKEVKVERLLRKFGAKAVVIRDDYTVFEVTGQEFEINETLKKLEEYGIIEFVRGSVVAMMKSSEGIHKRIQEIEEKSPIKDPVNNEFLHLRSKVFEM